MYGLFAFMLMKLAELLVKRKVLRSMSSLSGRYQRIRKFAVGSVLAMNTSDFLVTDEDTGRLGAQEIIFYIIIIPLLF
jgi:energy-coupling factor transporter ATP-binding protein EcfA2